MKITYWALSIFDMHIGYGYPGTGYVLVRNIASQRGVQQIKCDHMTETDRNTRTTRRFPPFGGSSWITCGGIEIREAQPLPRPQPFPGVCQWPPPGPKFSPCKEPLAPVGGLPLPTSSLGRIQHGAGHKAF